MTPDDLSVEDEIVGEVSGEEFSGRTDRWLRVGVHEHGDLPGFSPGEPQRVEMRVEQVVGESQEGVVDDFPSAGLPPLDKQGVGFVGETRDLEKRHEVRRETVADRRSKRRQIGLINAKPLLEPVLACLPGKARDVPFHFEIPTGTVSGPPDEGGDALGDRPSRLTPASRDLLGRS